jgi:hypothetical protein
MQQLSPHHSNGNEDIHVYYSSELLKNHIVISFKVHSNILNTNHDFLQEGWGNIGLWDFDVVEVFIQFSDQADGHYLELQVSPLGQKLALLIRKPRLEYEKINTLLGQADATVSEKGFLAEFKIDYRDIPGFETTKTNEIKAGLFACLGPVNARNYFALNINTDAQADFHRPELFKKIGRYEG